MGEFSLDLRFFISQEVAMRNILQETLLILVIKKFQLFYINIYNSIAW